MINVFSVLIIFVLIVGLIGGLTLLITGLRRQKAKELLGKLNSRVPMSDDVFTSRFPAEMSSCALKIRGIIAKEYGISPLVIYPTDHLIDNLGIPCADNLCLESIIVDIEKTFGIKFEEPKSEEEVRRLLFLEDFVAHVYKVSSR